MNLFVLSGLMFDFFLCASVSIVCEQNFCCFSPRSKDGKKKVFYEKNGWKTKPITSSNGAFSFVPAPNSTSNTKQKTTIGERSILEIKINKGKSKTQKVQTNERLSLWLQQLTNRLTSMFDL
jgi:hypothetical protein